jgi:pimeloyl-ACP methyl ester carboxylesterase
MPKITVNDITMYYETHGEGEPLILISGFGADHLMWDEVVSRLKNNYKVIVFDNRGAGQTDVPQKPYTIAEMSDDTAQLCHQLHIKKAHFIGNSILI